MFATIARVREFFRDGLWHDDLESLPKGRALGLGVLRIVVHAGGSFFGNLGGIRAAGLTLITLLSLVPLLALAFAIATGFGYRVYLEQLLVEKTRDLPQDLQTAAQWIRALVDKTDFRTIGWLGSLVLAWTGLGLFVRVEEALNHVWKTKRGRAFHRRVTDFVALVVFVPVLVIGAVSLSSLLQTADVAGLRAQFAWLDMLYRAGLGFVPPLLLTIAFTAIYKLMPSVEVTWTGSVVGGAVAGIAWISVHALYVRFQIGVAGANAIYATLAALPLLLIYLQLTWTILLLGAEIAYAVQNLHSLRGRVLPRPSWSSQRRLALAAVDAACRAFESGAGGLSVTRLAMQADVPFEWVDEVCQALQRSGLLVTVEGTKQLMPARPPARIAIADVLEAIETQGSLVEVGRLPLRVELSRSLARHDDAGRATISGGSFA